jgi:hypothetical protein
MRRPFLLPSHQAVELGGNAYARAQCRGSIIPGIKGASATGWAGLTSGHSDLELADVEKRVSGRRCTHATK